MIEAPTRAFEKIKKGCEISLFDPMQVADSMHSSSHRKHPKHRSRAYLLGFLRVEVTLSMLTILSSIIPTGLTSYSSDGGDPHDVLYEAAECILGLIKLSTLFIDV